jgi:hypothetical protein
MTKDELVKIMSDSVEETNRRQLVTKSTPPELYEESLKWNRPSLDYMNEMIVEELVRRKIVSVE